MSVAKDFARAAASYDSAAFLAREVGRRMAERLECVRLKPHRFADIGCATGDGLRILAARYPQALPLAIDLAYPMLAAVRARAGWWARLSGRAPRLVNADVRALPLAAESLDLVWSNLMLHWLEGPDELAAALTELHRVLAQEGLLHFSLLGPDTLKELRRLGAPIRRFADMHDIGDLLARCGFADPVMEMEMITLTYRSPRLFLADQRRLGARGLLGHLSWRDWRKLFAAWERQDGFLPAHFEVVYGHAWKAAPKHAVIHFQRRAATDQAGSAEGSARPRR
ncbi:MAG: methyltransferase domain-containing protein [Rhodocyclaceae bacterium]|nr:methyltransferase domain-containing protein [Rhodocyclaceae bacterium]